MLWGLTTFFNPAGSDRRLTNYRRFRAASAAQGLRLVTVELAFGDQPFVLRAPDDAELLVQRRSSAVLWQKERLLNLGLAALPRDCTGVCWIDADLVFADPDWVRACEALLTQHAVLQPFEHVVRLPDGGAPEQFPASELDRSIPAGTGDATYSVSLGSQLRRWLPRFAGTTGYAWCAQRKLLDAVGFYDRCIVGGGDREFALALAYPPGKIPARQVRITHRPLRAHIQPWHAQVWARAGKSIGFRPGLVHHLWHGSSAKRNYVDRHQILSDHDFDPEADLTLDAGGCWAWTGRNPGLERAVAEYLESGRDNG